MSRSTSRYAAAVLTFAAIARADVPATTRPSDGWVSVTQPPATRPTALFDRAAGCRVNFYFRNDGIDRFEFVDGPAKTRWTWDGRALHRHDLSPGEGDPRTENAGPYFITDATQRLAAIRAEGKAIAARSDANVDVYRIGDDRKLRVDAARDRVVADLALPTTRPAGISYEYHYGIDVPNVHALGVPRDAPIVDDRPTGLAKRRLDAWNATVRPGPPAGVTLVTRTAGPEAVTDGRPMLDQLVVYARRGDAWIAATYLVGDRPGADAVWWVEPPQLARPTGWPTPDVATTLDALATIGPYAFVCCTPERFSRVYSNGQSSVQATCGWEAASDAFPGVVWPGSESLGVCAGGAKTSTTADQLCVTDISLFDVNGRTDRVVDVDPNGRPTRFEERQVARNHLFRLEATTLRATAVFADGRALPTRWLYEYSRPQIAPTYHFDCVATPDATARVPDAWWARVAAATTQPLSD